MPDEPLFDRSALLENLDHDLELLRLMAKTFVDDVPRLLTELRAALRAGDAPEAARASHNIKGSAANFGAARLVEQVVAMEQACRCGELAKASAAAKDAERLIVTLAVELRREFTAR
ncbi:MAG TPA: Hpt domain-containing protein [Aromatoleum sp.]|uniref:Hpt domain-containing protein n=1 Tax=Aromatoleum sp. TaxID=2307007 RepID=UPI002B45A774|nr:Hpt domain-containing protein [Aromatoleum sp.]HJV28208.1 Hpt domain-containing protein [Aromatoleum sp.]